MRQTAIDFYTKDRLSLVGILTTPEAPGPPFPTMLVCHHHPALGGNMEHPLMTTICRTGHREGISSLRFNFRGVGDSQGSFSNGPDEQEDLRPALNIMEVLPDVDPLRLAVVGYSFGASAVLGGLKRCKAARGLVLIAPPISSVKNSRIRKDKRPKLFIVGERDRVVPSVDLQRVLEDVRQPLQFVELPDADHALVDQEQVVAEHVAEFLLTTLGREDRI